MDATEPSWDLYRSFLAVLREGSLSGAARTLDLAQPTVGRHVDALETALRLQLFTRSQHGLAATEAALELKVHAEAMAATAAALARTASGAGGGVRGTVRVTASEVIGAEADIAVRMVEPTQGSLLVRRIGEVTLGFHARGDYLARRGTPDSMAALKDHLLIGFDRPSPWIRDIVRTVPHLDTSRFLLRTDSDLAQFAAIRLGCGIGVCQAQLGRREGLTRLLEDEFELRLATYVAMHEDLRSTPRCRAVFDAVVAGLLLYVGTGEA